MAYASEKSDTEYIEGEGMERTVSRFQANGHEVVGFEADESTLPKGYFFSRFFIGSYLAIAFSLWAGTASFAYAAPILAQINADIGPDQNLVWVSLVYTVCSAVWFPIVGRIGDIFGRRYLMIGGTVCALVGSIICATAQDIPTLIGGNVFLGSAAAVQLSFSYVLAEILPMKHRYLGSGLLYPWSIAGSGMGPVISYAFVTRYPDISWRGLYWFLLAINVAALICWVAFYFPPDFSHKHQNDQNSKMYFVKHFDYVGTFLFTGGFVVFILGLSWGGTIYAWKSAAVISALIVGFATLVAFVLWESFGPMEQPLIPMHLFLNGRWSAAAVILGLGAGIYYAFAIVWPSQVAVLYANGDPMYTGYLSSIIGMGFISGQILSGLLARHIGRTKFQCMFGFLLGGTLLGCAATVTPTNKSTEIGLIYVGCLFVGWNEGVALNNVVITVKDQREVGVAGGAAGCVRSGISAILTAVYTTILTNRLAETIPAEVPPALVQAGLPESSVAGFISGITAGSFEGVQGVTAQIMEVGMRAYQQANADAYRTVYLSTIAFSGVAVILTFWAPNTEEYMTTKIAATLGNQGVVEYSKEGKEEV
ncbi:MFS general substrate transporter [Aulographum hederae CBS 113979]|uniref:MFS general substrate transporter n=1 Tax=Aulographum hederae CBS 113979 TaxID=1176131 RepID=A0A6G1GIL3_9PEZI|nr:MFS general substrate transporter [Aulographum hederae CBS 113979]